MLEAIHDALVPFSKPVDEHALAAERALSYFVANPKGNISALAAELGCSKRTAERIVSGLKKSGALKRIGSARGGYWEIDPRA